MTIEDLPEPSLEGVSLIERERFLFPSSETSVTFAVAAAPMPLDCEFSFFDPNDAACQEILFNPKTSVSELFAILRQWVPQVQQNIDVIGNEIIKRGCNVNDRDGLTDMTLLHYTCKSGAHGIGDVETAVKFATQLLELGADISLRSRWTNMNALHYAAYFDVPELISLILKNAKPKDVDATCSDFDFGTALHIAAFNLCTGAVKCLLEHGANPAFRNDKGQIPADVVPDPVDMPLEMADAAASAKEIKQILLDAVPLSCDISKAIIPNYDHVTGKAMLLSLGLKLGDRVVIAGQKVGTLRFCGTTEFASGQWAGIELDHPEGKNNGSVGRVQYFKCAPKRGIFAPLSKISKASDHKRGSVRGSSLRSAPLVKAKKIDVTHVTSKVNSGLNMAKKDSAAETNFITPSRGKTVPAKEGFPGYSSSSSSTTSLEGKQNYSKKRNLTSSNKKPVARLSSASSKISAGLHSFSPAARKKPFDEGEIQIGDRVLVVGQRTGTVRFCGMTKFAPGFWCGIELDKPHGKNDGSVGGVQYFSCLPRYGIFAPPSRVQRLAGSLDSLTETSSSKLSHTFPGRNVRHWDLVWRPLRAPILQPAHATQSTLLQKLALKCQPMVWLVPSLRGAVERCGVNYPYTGKILVLSQKNHGRAQLASAYCCFLCHLLLRNKFFPVRVGSHWSRLPREVVDVSSLEVLGAGLDEALSKLVWWEVPLAVAGGVGTG